MHADDVEDLMARPADAEQAAIAAASLTARPESPKGRLPVDVSMPRAPRVSSPWVADDGRRDARRSAYVRHRRDGQCHRRHARDPRRPASSAAPERGVRARPVAPASDLRGDAVAAAQVGGIAHAMMPASTRFSSSTPRSRGPGRRSRRLERDSQEVQVRESRGNSADVGHQAGRAQREPAGRDAAASRCFTSRRSL